MDAKQAVKHWQELSEERMQELGDWQEKHPKATLREIEQALDKQMLKLRAQVLEEAAQLSEMRVWTESENIPVCPDCRKALEFRMKGKRELQTHGGHRIQLEREYGICPKYGRAFSPLDEELELIGGKLTPHAYESLVRFGTILPFGKAAKELAFVLQVEVSEPTVRRYVEAAGKAYEDYQTGEVERLEKDCPPGKKGPPKNVLECGWGDDPVGGRRMGRSENAHDW